MKKINIGTRKLDRNGIEIKCGNRVLVTSGSGFQAVGNIKLETGGIIIDWDDNCPCGCYSNFLYDYGEETLRIINRQKRNIPFHEAIKRKSEK